MNRKYYRQLLFFACLLIVLLGCARKQVANNCLFYTKAPVTKIEGATTVLVGQEIDLTVSFGCSNGCGQFDNFEENISGNTTIINVIAKYEGCICTEIAPTLKTSYTFKKSQTGTYELKFLKDDNSYLTHTIIVQ